MMSEESILDESVAQTEQETTEAVENPDTQMWYLSEDVAGQGDAPDWFKANKYKTVADQAKAYAGLESKLGSFTGAPDGGYEVVMPEGIDAEIPEGDAMLDQFNEWAANAGLSQEAHTELLGLYVNNVMEQVPDVESEIKRIGPDANTRIESMVKWGRANLNENEFETLQSLATTAEGFQLLEKMRSMTRETQVSAPDTAKPASGLTAARLQEMVADPRYESSPSFRAEVEAKFREFYGTQPQSEIRS